MKTIDVPFNKHIGIQTSEENSEYLLYLDAMENHLNHLGTVHASALFSLAEASSGEYLLNTFESISEDVIPVVRKADIRFRKTVNGKINSRAELLGTTREEVLEQLEIKKRALINVKVDIYNEDYSKVFSSVFEWFVTIA